MRNVVRKALLAMTALAGIAFSGCSSESSSTPMFLPSKPAKKATEISVVSNTGIDSVAVGNEITLLAKGNGSVKGPYTWQITGDASAVSGPLVSGAETPLELEKQTSSKLVLRGKATGTVKIKVSTEELESAEYTLKVETLKVYITDDANATVKQTKKLKLKAVSNGAVSATVYNWEIVSGDDCGSLEAGVTSSSINLTADKAGSMIVKVTLKDGNGAGSDLVSDNYSVTIDPIVLTITGSFSVTAGKSALLKVSNDVGFVPAAGEMDNDRKYRWSTDLSGGIINVVPMSSNTASVQGVTEGTEKITVSLLGVSASVDFEVAPFKVTIPAVTREVVSFGKTGLKVTATNNDGRTGNYNWKITNGTGSASFAAVTGAETPVLTTEKTASYVNVYGGKIGTVTLTAEKDGVTSAPVTITVKPFELAITGSDSVTTGGTTKLTASSSNANLGTLPFTWALAEGSEGIALEPASTTKTQTVKASDKEADIGKSGKVKVTVGGVTSGVKSLEIKDAANVITKNDRALGFAKGIDPTLFTQEITVDNAADLKSYAKKGGYVIYVRGIIDMTDGLLPAAGKTSTDLGTSAMDAWIAKNGGTTYSAWYNTNSNHASSADTGVDSLSSAFTKLTRIQPASNTAIIGEKGAVIRGCNISIGTNNVVIRNLTLQDGIDPFPHHESGDGYNAQNDVICIDKGTNVWIDHCTLEDTLTLGKAKNGEKWQVYDGLLDMKNACTNITVSFCHFKNHDKTMLIGSSDSDGDNTKRFVTLANNYFQECGQRLPMVRGTRIHVYNCIYENTGAKYTSQSTINARKNSIVCAQSNTIIAGKEPSTKDGGVIYDSDLKIFDVAPRYSYQLGGAAKSKTGAGICVVRK